MSDLTKQEEDQAIASLSADMVEQIRLSKLSNLELFSEILSEPDFDDDLRVLALMDRLHPGWFKELADRK